MKYYSAIKINEILFHATLCINFENIILTERSQSQRITYGMTSSIWCIWNRQIY